MSSRDTYYFRPRFEVRVLGIWTVIESMTGTREQLRSQMRWYARPFLTLHKRVPVADSKHDGQGGMSDV